MKFNIKNKWVMVSGGVVSIIGLVLIGYGSFRQIYKGKIYPNTFVLGVDLSGKTTEQAKEILQPKLNEIVSRQVVFQTETQNQTATLADFGISYDTAKIADQAYQNGRGDVEKSVKESAKLAINPTVITPESSIDEQKFTDSCNKLAANVSKVLVEPTLKFENGQIVIIPGTAGVTVDVEQFNHGLKNKIQEKDFTAIAIPTKITQPINDAPDVLAAQKEAQGYLTKSVTLTYNNISATADKSIIGTWLIFPRVEGKLTASIDSGKISGWIGSVAKKIDIAKKDKEVLPNGQVVKEGNDGQAVDRNDALSKVKQALSAGNAATIALIVNPVPRGTKNIALGGTPGMANGRYIEINLSKQTLYAFDGTTLVNQGAISSGVSAHPTPRGLFHIYGKSRVTRMSGPGYDLSGVEWVSWFSGDYSIHGTYWHSNFGHPMSHGCINATNAYASWLYGWAPVGTPVYIH